MKSALIQWNSHSRGGLPRSVIITATAATRRPSLVRPYHPVAVDGSGMGAGEARRPILAPPSSGRIKSPRQPLQPQSEHQRLVVQSRRKFAVAAVTDGESTVDESPTTSKSNNNDKNNQPKSDNQAPSKQCIYHHSNAQSATCQGIDARNVAHAQTVDGAR